MPEDQNVTGEEWNQRFNHFLREVAHWNQLGKSNVDIYCERLRSKVGLDSVFSYRRNSRENQKIVLVEAKSYNFSNVNPGKIQTWVQRLSDKISCAQSSHNFQEQFSVDINSEIRLGLIGLWVRDVENYSHAKIQQWLSQIITPVFKNPINICFITNQEISRFGAIHKITNELIHSGAYAKLSFHLPNYGKLSYTDGNWLPIEVFLSKIVFYKGKKKQKIKGRNEDAYYDAYVVFYLGEVKDYNDLRFVGLALREFQILATEVDIDIYTLVDKIHLRNYQEKFLDEFSMDDLEIGFHHLSVSNNLPGWLADYD